MAQPTITATFSWPAEVQQAPVTLTMPAAALAARDPDSTSLIAGKIRFVGGEGEGTETSGDAKDVSVQLSAAGPDDGTYFHESLIRFVYVQDAAWLLIAACMPGRLLAARHPPLALPLQSIGAH